MSRDNENKRPEGERKNYGDRNRQGGSGERKNSFATWQLWHILSAKAHNIELFYLKRVFKGKLAKPKERDLITKQVRTCLIAVGGIRTRVSSL